jgi:2-oxo-4-hydroxy-4-carboxy-5-ureidoimidazoline decarboxylase
VTAPPGAPAASAAPPQPPHTWLNALPAEEARRALERCCGAGRWVDGMLAARPFTSAAALHQAADAVWAALGPPDFLEAFAHHPAIGARAESLSAWSSEEQARAAEGAAAVAAELGGLNQAYAARFGYTFIICATGRSAPEILAQLRARLGNDADTELSVAAAEQASITHLRLEKLAR